MEMRELLDNISNAKLRARNVKSKVESLIGTNEYLMDRKNTVGKELEVLNTLVSGLELYLNDAKRLHEGTVQRYADYRKGKLSYLEEILTGNLNYIFELKNPEAKIDYVSRGKNSKASLIIKEGNHSMRPKNCSGGLMQELVGFTTVDAILEFMNSSILFNDEAFSMSDDINKEKLSYKLQERSDNGKQTILVSQSPLLYKGIDSRLIYLEPVVGSLASRIAKVEDVRREKVITELEEEKVNGINVD